MSNNRVALLVLPLLMIMESLGQLEKIWSVPLALLTFIVASMEASSSGFGFKECLSALHTFIKLLELLVKQEIIETPLLSDSFLLRIFVPAAAVWINILILQQRFSDLPGIGIASDGIMDRCNAITNVGSDRRGEDDGFFGVGTVLFVALYLLLYSVLGSSSKSED